MDALESSGWRTSSRCESTHCVEVLLRSERVTIRDAGCRGGACVEVAPVAWVAFIDLVKSGRLDSSGAQRWGTS
jgi:hypothetical protein